MAFDAYFAASELEAFTWTGTPTTSVSANDVDLNHVRCGIQLESKTSESITATYSAPVNEAWIHYNIGSGDNSANAINEMLVIKGGGVDLFRILYTAGVPSLQYWDSAAYQTVSTGVFQVDNSMDVIDIYIKMDGVSGVIEWYVNQNKVGASFIGDTIFTAELTIDSMTFKHPDTSGSFFDFITISEVIASNTRAKYLQTLDIDGAGADAQFTGLYTDINENNVDDANLIGSSLTADVSTYTKTAMPALEPFEQIAAVVETARIRNNGVAPVDAQFVTRSGGAAYSFSANISGIGTGYNPFQNILLLDPNTAAAWTLSNLNSTQMGLKSI